MRLAQLLISSVITRLIVISQPNGKYGVSLTDHDLVDASRPDPYSNAPERKIPISIFTPIDSATECRTVEKKYMPDPTALYWEQYFGKAYDLSLNNTFSQLALSLCEPDYSDKRHPLILFSPGQGMPHHLYHILAADIASEGFTVVTVDAPGEMGLTTYLDGTTQPGTAKFTTEAQNAEGVEVRVRDVQFVLETLPKLIGSGSHLQAGRQTGDSPDLQAAIFGHSFGGATALSSILASPKTMIGGVDLDGALFGAPLIQSTEKPFAILASDDSLRPHNQSTMPSWTAAWSNMRGPKWQLKLINSTHATFTDVPVLAAAFGLLNVPGLDAVIGSIQPHKALSTQVSVLSALATYLFGQQVVGHVLDVANASGAIVVENATNVA